ncbi:MAG: SGNH/GDSL hydrolase family protein [Pseudomonadota bacterium]
MLMRAALSWLMLPVYVWQGTRLRMRIERLLPADVPVSGIVGEEYNDDPLRVLVIGDSTVASVGMEKLEDTFAYSVAQSVAKAHSMPVEWRSAGANSATSGELRDFVLPNIDRRDWTHIFISVGINDMKNFHLAGHFKRNFGTLLYALRTRFPDSEIIWTPIPNMKLCPALPKRLAEVLAARADVINAMGVRMCRERRAIHTTPVGDVDASCFARDGFHPNGKGYRVWADHVAPWFKPDDAKRQEADAGAAQVTRLPRRA